MQKRTGRKMTEDSNKKQKSKATGRAKYNEEEN